MWAGTALELENRRKLELPVQTRDSHEYKLGLWFSVSQHIHPDAFSLKALHQLGLSENSLFEIYTMVNCYLAMQ